MPDFLMKLVLAEPKYLKDPIAIASELVNEVTFKVNSDGLEMVAMDPANVAMVVLKILSSSFVEFNVPNGTEEFSISLANLKQILRRAKGDDVLTLETGEENQLKVILKGKSARSFTIALLELDEREQKVPDLNFPCNITMPAAQLTDAIEDVSVVAESVTLPKILVIWDDTSKGIIKDNNRINVKNLILYVENIFSWLRFFYNYKESNSLIFKVCSYFLY